MPVADLHDFFYLQISGVLILSNLILSSIVVNQRIQLPEYYHQSNLIFFLRSGNGRDRKQPMTFSVSYTNEPENISINNLSLTEIFEEAIISATKRQNIFTYYQYLFQRNVSLKSTFLCNIDVINICVQLYCTIYSLRI